MSGSDPTDPRDPGSERPSLELPSLFRRRRRAPARPERAPVETTAAVPPPQAPLAPEAGGRSEDARRRRLAPGWAALLVGVVVGAVSGALVWVTLRSCHGLRGTTSCGDPGLLAYLAIFLVAVILGRLLLATLQVPEAGSTSLLASAMLAVLGLVASSAGLGGWSGAAALVLLAAACFGLARWATATFTEPGDRPR